MTLRDLLKQITGVDSSEWTCEPEEMGYNLEILDFPFGIKKYPLDLVVVYDEINTIVVS